MIKKIFFQTIPLTIATLFCCLPFNFIIGSKAAWFSYSGIVIPALGYQSSLLYVILFVFTKGLLSSSSLLFAMMHRLPTVCSTLALQKRDWKVSIVVPCIAVILFTIHPVGQQVFYYASYWFIPMILYSFAQDSLYSRALSASFIAHAVGSVIWLYAGNITAQEWTALMPIVMIERFFIAAGMIAFIHLFQKISDAYRCKVTA